MARNINFTSQTPHLEVPAYLTAHGVRKVKGGLHSSLAKEPLAGILFIGRCGTLPECDI